MKVLFKFLYDIVWCEGRKRSILLHHRRIAEKVRLRDPEGAMKTMVDHLADMERILSQRPETKIHGWTKP